jgi:hypothetical protein
MALQLVVFHWFIMPLSSPVLIQLGILLIELVILKWAWRLKVGPKYGGYIRENVGKELRVLTWMV